jgi:hypothetical protein
MQKLPHPIPYQGSKRRLAEAIGSIVPNNIATWYEPFAGSAAMSLWAARYRNPDKIVLGDSLASLAKLWELIIADPVNAAERYEAIWHGHIDAGPGYFNEVRARYNEQGDPIDILYLMARCVKNAVRFNRKGHFTQSVDKRRLGMRPDKMRNAMMGASDLLKGRTVVRSGDWTVTTADAVEGDFVYLELMTTYINMLGAKFALITGISYAYDHIHKPVEIWGAANLKTVVGGSSPWVRIPPCPPLFFGTQLCAGFYVARERANYSTDNILNFFICILFCIFGIGTIAPLRFYIGVMICRSFS